MRLAFRNIFRQKRRSFFTMLSIMGSFVLCSMAIGLVYGTYGKVIDTFTRGHSGHIEIHAPGFLERPSLFKNIRDYENLIPLIEKNKEILSLSPRVVGAALISQGEKTTGAKMFGIDPEKEEKTTTIKNKISEGAFLSGNINNDIVLGNALAKILAVKIGDPIVLMTQAADGSMSNDTFTVIGILSEASDAMEARNAYLHIKTAQEFLVLGNRIHELVIRLTDFNQARDVASKLKLDIKNLEVSPWQEIEAEFYKAMTADQTGIWIDLGIMLFIVSIGVLNTVLMTILERTREFGILKAIGTRPQEIFMMVVLETSILTSVSVFIGMFIALFINYQLSLTGIPYPMPIEIGGMALHYLYSQVSWFNLWVPALVVSMSSIGVSVIPALRAAQIVPVKAIRST
jgi:ABC-type lipoprotein release transport system permease subunit